MQKIHLIILLVTFYSQSYHTMGQVILSEKEQELQTRMWVEDKDFITQDIPEKWQSEDAVILVKKLHTEYKKVALSNNLLYARYLHERVKIQGAQALKNYGQFEILESGKYFNTRHINYASFRITKASGQEVIIRHHDGVKEKNESGHTEYNIIKIAIPNLEIGDIIDYYIYKEEVINLYGAKYHAFDPLIFQLNGEYPIMSEKISFDVMRKCFINQVSTNGAPEMKLETNSDKNRYYIHATDLESVTNPHWFYPNRELPTIKFKVTYAYASYEMPFLGAQGVLKSSISKPELEKRLEQAFRYSAKMKGFNKYMKKAKKEGWDRTKIAKEAYYKLRNSLGVKNIRADMIRTGYSVKPIKSPKFISILSTYYRKMEIPHQIMVGVPRNIASLNDLVLENELIFVMKVLTTDPFYIGQFDSSSTIGMVDQFSEGVKVYSFDGSTLPYECDLQLDETPISSYQENFIASELTIELEEDSLHIDIKRSIGGLHKSNFQQHVVSCQDVINDEINNYGIEPLSSYVSPTEKESYAAYNEKFNEYQSEWVKNNINSNFGLELDKVNNFKVIQTGRMEGKEDLIIETSITTNELVKKVGKNIIINVGALIEQQVNFSEKDKERKYDVWMPFARSYKHQINFKIPEGYSIHGVDQLNHAVENEQGGFVSTAEVSNGYLTLNINKHYKSNFVDVANWQELLSFLEVASEFNGQDILLKK